MAKKRGRSRKAATKQVSNNDPNNTDPETSPFKGFSNLRDEKDALFDTLLDDNKKPKFSHNIKTYTNKRKDIPDKPILEFHENRNRSEVIKWLNDNRNSFDRVTQTQVHDSDTEAAFDMPSVSQRITSKGSTQRAPKRKRSPYKLRARSLDVHVKKNSQRGRNRRHSLAGDSPDLENYQIEEVDTDVEAPIPADPGAKIIIDLMEDEYLNNLEKEMLQDERKNQSGWDRIRDLNKTIKTKKQPKQLDVAVKSQSKSNPCYDFDVFENYFIQVAEKLAQNGDKSAAPTQKEAPLTDALQAGETFIVLAEKLGAHDLDELRPLAARIQRLFAPPVNTTSVQTELDTKTATVQTTVDTASQHVQTCPDVTDAKTQTDTLFTSTKVVQTNIDTVDVGVPPSQTPSIASSATTSDVFVLNVHEEKGAFDDDLDFDTEELIKAETAAMMREQSQAATAESELVVSNEENIKSQGTKRLRDATPEPVGAKRPCAKFIEEDLSVSFASCVEENEDGRGELRREFQVLTGDSDIGERFKAVLAKHQNSPKKNRTQEHIAELEDMIARATTESRLPRAGPSTASQKDEIVETHRRKSTTQEQIAELEAMITDATKAERDPLVEAKNEVVILDDDTDYFSNDPSPKKSRRNLFGTKDKESEMMKKRDQQQSESLFGSEKTLTEANVDVLMKDTPSRINILENIVVNNNPVDDALLDSDDTGMSDVDFVECTPQNADYKSREHSRQEADLDVTLPPPVEFQDTDFMSPPRRPLADINKITSTPMSQKPDSENFLSLSPILEPPTSKTSLHSYLSNQENRPNGPKAKRANKRVLGPYELAQQQTSKFSPLTVIKKPLYQNSLPGTPKQKSLLSYIRPSQESSFDSGAKRKPCIACSRLKREEIMTLSSLTSRKFATYSATFSPMVTHLIVAVTEENRLIDHTIKFVSAVAAGLWVLNFGWVKECLAKNAIVPEKPYEVLDVTGQPGPQKSRLLRLSQPLLKGFKIYVAAPFSSTTKEEVENVIVMLGGKVVRAPELLLDRNGHTCVIVAEARATQDFHIYETWMDALRVVTVDIEWISRSVGQYQVLSLRPFTLSPEEFLDSLGYPPELTMHMVYSFSQQTFTTGASSD